MRSSPLVSIIINCFNGEQYLAETLNSVLKQSYDNWQVIFWDNQSTDKSAEVFKTFNDSRFKYFYAAKHTILGEARNLAVSQASGDWLAFLDTDDIWLPEKLEKQIDVILKSVDIACVYCRTLIYRQKIINSVATMITENMGRYGDRELPDGQIFDLLSKANIIPMVSALIKKSIFTDIGGCDIALQFCEDYDIFLKIAENHLFGVVQEPYCLYRVHNNNLSRNIMELGYTEPLVIIKQFEGRKNIKEALIIHNIRYSVYLIKTKEIYTALIVIKNIGLNIFSILNSIKYLLSYKKKSIW